MKKVITIAMILALMISSASFAEVVDESFYVGTWVCFEYLQTEGCVVSLFRLEEDHTCYFLLRSFSNAEDGHGRENVKTWSSKGNDLTIVTGNTSWDLFVTSEYKLAREVPGGYEVYERVGGSSGVPSSSSSSGLTVPVGVYVAGEDFPAGIYRIELVDETKKSHVRLYNNMEEVNKAFAYIYDYDLGNYYGATAVGKMEILDGNALKVGGAPIILLPYEGLK